MPPTYNTYQIRIRHKGEEEKPWSAIHPEIVHSSNFMQATTKVCQLDMNFIDIIEVRVNDVRNKEYIHLVKKDGGVFA